MLCESPFGVSNSLITSGAIARPEGRFRSFDLGRVRFHFLGYVMKGASHFRLGFRASAVFGGQLAQQLNFGLWRQRLGYRELSIYRSSDFDLTIVHAERAPKLSARVVR